MIQQPSAPSAPGSPGRPPSPPGPPHGPTLPPPPPAAAGPPQVASAPGVPAVDGSRRVASVARSGKPNPFRATKRHPNNAMAHHALAVAQAQAGNPALALTAAKDAVARAPAYAPGAPGVGGVRVGAVKTRSCRSPTARSYPLDLRNRPVARGEGGRIRRQRIHRVPGGCASRAARSGGGGEGRREQGGDRA